MEQLKVKKRVIFSINEIVRKELDYNGVYKITNTVNDKFYIGSCSSKTFLYERLKHHQADLINNEHCNKYLQRSFNKHGSSAFIIEILEVCKPVDCIEREQYWIDLLNPHYNSCKIAGSSFGVECTPETRVKISNANKQFWSDEVNRSRMKIAFSKRPPRTKESILKSTLKRIGSKHSVETKLKISNAHKGKKLSEETKVKLRGPRARRKVINLITLIVYDSYLDAAQKCNITPGYIASLICYKRDTNKYKFRYV